MGLLRSETMKYARLVLPAGAEAKTILEEIGKPGAEHCNVEFVDSNAKLMQRPFRHYVAKVDELLRILKAVKDDLVEGQREIKTAKIEEFFQNKELDMDKIEKELKVYDEQFRKLSETHARLIAEKVDVEEELALNKFAESYLERSSAGGSSMETPLLSEADGVGLNTVAGVMETKDHQRLWKAVWRASRGKAFFQSAEIQQTLEARKAGEMGKECFVVYFQGGVDSAMKSRLERVCVGYGANLYSWPTYGAAAKQQKNKLEQDLEQKREVLEDFEKTRNSDRDDMLHECGSGNSKVEEYLYFAKKEKALYSLMNYFEEGQTLATDVWFPACEEEKFKALLNKCNVTTKPLLLPQRLPGGQEPPTFTKVNDLTAPWQEVVDTYGIPNYQTFNPAVITTVTFPFIFGMMYGDIGHGFLLFCAGAVMCVVGPGMKYSAPMVYYARYVILQMGLFAVFAGFMYNDLFGMVSLELFESRYNSNASADKLHHPLDTFDSLNLGKEGASGPYPFGIDYMWHGKANELLFVNSLKMKLSVLMGVLQMTLGVFLKWANAFHDRSKIDFFCECIPMLMFMMCFFGYMDYMILYKWTHVIPGSTADPNIHWKGYDNNTLFEGPPGIINSLICMAMHTKDPQPLFAGAGSTASYCMLGVLLSVPWILGPKPFLLKNMHQKGQKTKAKKVAKEVTVIVLEQLQDPSFTLDESVMHFVEAAVAKFPEITRNKDSINNRANQDTYEPSRASLAESRSHWISCREELLEAIKALLTMDAKGSDPKLSRTVTSKLRDELVAIGEFHHLEMGDVGGGHGHGGKFEFGEVMIHQIIETIEYVLGTVSHTASYLRIWALSLAHQQLSDVFFKKTLGMAFAMSSSDMAYWMQGMIIWFMFGAWFLVTVLVLLMMDVLECFLHTLRLHWVEFQSKFYRNNGRAFRPHDLMAVVMDSDQ